MIRIQKSEFCNNLLKWGKTAQLVLPINHFCSFTTVNLFNQINTKYRFVASTQQKNIL